MTTPAAEVSSVIDIRRNRLRSNLILELYQHGQTSINRMARLFHASIPSATGIVNDLIKEGWIHETGTAVARAGRPPALYGLNTQKYYTLILDITRHDTQLVVFDLDNEFVAKQQVDLKLEDSEMFLDALIDEIDIFLKANSISSTKLWGIGVSMPGLINVQKGTNQTYPHLTGEDLSLAARLETQFQLPVSLINDTHATTIGEHRFGLAKGKQHVLTINIDWGVGLGILLNGEVFNGASGFAGELGHIQVQPNGLLCHCGKIGCLDTLTSGFALMREAQAGIEAGRDTALPRLVGENDSLDTHHIIEAAHAGDDFCIELITNLGAELGKGIATAVHMFNPEIVIITGLLAEAGPFIANPVKQAIQKYCLADFRDALTLQVSELGSKARQWGVQVHLVEALVAREFS
ncbi:ROK family protein [Persicitalea sp.]|uniref:ROK family transcriptional regulator n=1 Tax=Persicitalea sp. TaxID=3100273 RepID=UPI0035934A2C